MESDVGVSILDAWNLSHPDLVEEVLREWPHLTAAEVYDALYRSFDRRMSFAFIGPESGVCNGQTPVPNWGVDRFEWLVEKYNGLYVPITQGEPDCAMTDFADALEQLGDWLEECDLVKFAGERPGPERSREAVERARRRTRRRACNSSATHSSHQRHPSVHDPTPSLQAGEVDAAGELPTAIVDTSPHNFKCPISHSAGFPSESYLSNTILCVTASRPTSSRHQ